MGEQEEIEKNTRKIVREEMENALKNYKFEVELPKTEEKPVEETEDCPDCGTKTRKTWKYCPDCGAEFDDSEE